MTTFVLALMLLGQAVPNVQQIQKPDTFLDKGQMPPLPAPNNQDESIIQHNLGVIARVCKQSPEAITALQNAAEYGEPVFIRVIGLYAIAIAAKQGCRDDALASAVLKGLQSEPPVDVCIQTVVGDFVAGAVSEIPCTVFDNALNIVEAAAWAAVYFGPPVEPALDAHRQFKNALEHIAADTDRKRHGVTIAAAKEALDRLEKIERSRR